MGRNAKYTSPQIIADFLEIMDSQVAKSVLKDMKTSGVFSLMIDESTDVSVLKQLVLYGRTVAEGKLKTRFLKIVDIEDGFLKHQSWNLIISPLLAVMVLVL